MNLSDILILAAVALAAAAAVLSIRRQREFFTECLSGMTQSAR